MNLANTTLAYYVHDLSPFIVRFTENFGIRWYGLAYVVAFVAGYFLLRWLARKGYGPLKEEQVAEFITWGAIFGVMIGGRLGNFIFYEPRTLIENPLVVFQVWKGGMASHGGILGLVLFTLWYAWRHNLNWPALGDNLVVAAPIGLFLGRVANFINGELYGVPAKILWAVKFPQELYEAPANRFYAALAAAREVSPQIATPGELIQRIPQQPELAEAIAPFLTPRHPSQLYEALLEGVALFLLLFFLRVKIQPPAGVVTGAFFAGYAAARIIAEFFKALDSEMIGALTRGQFLSLWMFPIALGFWFYAWKTRRHFDL